MERKNENEAVLGLVFFGVIGVAGEVVSASAGGRCLFMPIGGGAAESNEDARVDSGATKELRLELSSQSRKMAGPMFSSVQGRMLESRVEGRDSRSASSSRKG